MSLEQIKIDILKLTVEEQWEVSMWISDYLNQRWDEQMEADADAGRLDKLIDQAEMDYKQGLTKPL